MVKHNKYAFAFMSTLLFHLVATQSFNPTILQDSRDLPKVDGTFGFLYRTEDGIAHAAKGDSNGIIQGRFSYTDPTGLKVNFNYNAGSRTAPGYTYDETTYDDGQYHEQQQEQLPQSLYNQPQPERQQYETKYRESPVQYEEPQYIPQVRIQPRAQATIQSRRGQYSSRYRENDQQPRTRPASPTHNEVIGDYN